VLSVWVLHGQNLTDDEYAYWFTARLLARGQAVAPLWFPREFFRYAFVVSSNQHQFAIYGLVHPAILLPGVLVGWPPLSTHVLAGAAGLGTAAIARELYDDGTSVLAALLAAFSPFLLLTAATSHSSVTSAAGAALFLLGFLRFELHLRPRDGLVAGIALALMLHVRPL